MNPFALIPLKDWLYLGACAVIAAAGWMFVHHERELGAAHAEAQLQHERAAVAEASASAAAAAASETERRAAAIQEIVHETTQQTARVLADASAAAAERDSLRVQLDALRRQPLPAGAASASGSDATAATVRVLADLLGRADDRATALAAIADQRGTAGAACQRAYQALTTTTQPQKGTAP